MIRKIVLTILALAFLGFGFVATWGEANIGTRTGDPNHFYAAIFIGGVMGFVGILLLVLAFRKPGKPDPSVTGSAVWAVGMTTMMDDTGEAASAD